MSVSSCSTNSSRGTEYGLEGIDRYAKFGHGSDMHLFLSPFIAERLRNLNGKTLLDAGCGAAPWSIYAAEHGAHVQAIDIQSAMIERANRAIKQKGLNGKIKAAVGDATNLSHFKSDTFDHAISINVGCNLPMNVFPDHFKEMARVLKRGKSVDIGAPYSLATVFTQGEVSSKEGLKQIQNVLKDLPADPDPDEIQQHLNSLEDIISATFKFNEGRLALVTDESEFQPGQSIWRKLRSVTIPNYYHSFEGYLRAFKGARLELDSIDMYRFEDREARLLFNEKKETDPKLGAAYEKHPPFIIYHMKKPTA